MNKQTHFDPVNARTTVQVNGAALTIFSLKALEQAGYGPLRRFPYCLRLLLENVLRHHASKLASRQDVHDLASWAADRVSSEAIPFMPARVLLQDFTGVPVLADLAALRAAIARRGGDPSAIHPSIPVDLVIDHSVQVDCAATQEALAYNVGLEMERNRERYAMLRWGQQAFRHFRVAPPGKGIVHQVNLEYLASVVMSRAEEQGLLVYPDSVLGTDSHTTMINGLGVLGWGVGGIEAEAVLLGQPYSLSIPEVVGLRLHGALRPGTTATDLVLAITAFLRRQGVVGRFVEFFGPGVQKLSLPDRATVANMAPEYGATVGFFPVDRETLRYLEASGRPKSLIDLVDAYFQEQDCFLSVYSPEPSYSMVCDFDLAEAKPSLAGPKRPQDLLPLSQAPESFRQFLAARRPANSQASADAVTADARLEPQTQDVRDGAVVIAAITSCTNTSNPSVMLAAGLLARKARARGLGPKPWVKTSMAPGSLVVRQYLEQSGLLADLEALGFHIVGYGCTTCIGNSGPLEANIARRLRQEGIVAAAVLSGNRNFEARIHPQAQANYLASPPLVVAYALAGDMLIDLETEALGMDTHGHPVYLRDIWPSCEEIEAISRTVLGPELYQESYASLFEGDAAWQALPGGGGSLFEWDPASTYIREPPFFEHAPLVPAPPSNIEGARILAILGDSITTDHISPAGAIGADSPAGQYLQAQGAAPEDFNSFGSRRGNHEVMMRGTFANIRLRNRMASREGGFTRLMPEGIEMPIYEAAMRYQERAMPLIICAGKDYGAGSSRDWAAKGALLLGVRAVIAVSFERIHRSNLIGMGILPLQWPQGFDAAMLGLDGGELLHLRGLEGELTPQQAIDLTIEYADGRAHALTLALRLDNATEIDYFRQGGILHKVLRQNLAHQGR